MRDLQAINPEFMRPSRFASVSAFAVLTLAILSAPLAYGAAPDIPTAENPIMLLICGVLVSSMLLASAAVVFKWGWKTQYYGVSLIGIASISFLAIVPCLAILIYGGAALLVKACIAITYGVSHFFWCRRFAAVYRKIFDDNDLRRMIYQEESDAVYYMRRGDEFVLEKRLNFSQMPKDKFFLIFVVIAICMIPVMSHLQVLMSIPFVHVFLTVAMLPVSWMSIGLTYRGYLIFYSYPALIKRQTGKDVYIDLVTKHQPIKKPKYRPG